MGDVYASIAGAAVGALLGGFATWVKDRTAARQHVMDFLLDKRQKLDKNEHLLKVLEFLKHEREAQRQHLPLPAIPEGFDGRKLRDLPTFLEPIGTYLEYNPYTFDRAYGFFADEVLLCADSKSLWADEKVPFDESTYWRSFSKFADRTRRSVSWL